MRSPRVVAIVVSAKRNHRCRANSYSEEHREECRPQIASQPRCWRQKAELGVDVTLRMHSFLQPTAKLCAGETVPHLASILERSQSGARFLLGGDSTGHSRYVSGPAHP